MLNLPSFYFSPKVPYWWRKDAGRHFVSHADGQGTYVVVLQLFPANSNSFLTILQRFLHPFIFCHFLITSQVSVAVSSLQAKGLPFISVLADPTYGGVSASYAMQSDVRLAVSDDSRIGFAGELLSSSLCNGFEEFLSCNLIVIICPALRFVT